MQQTWRKFLSNAWEMKVLIGVNYIMTVNQLSSITIFWDCNHFISNVNIFARPRNQAVFDNNQFANNTKQNETKKAIKLELSMTQMNPFKQYVLMNIWQSSEDISVSCLNIIKFYNNDMDGVDIINQNTATYRLSILKASIAFTWACFLISWMSYMQTVILFTWNLVITYRY